MYVSATTLVWILGIIGLAFIFAKGLLWELENLLSGKSNPERTKAWNLYMNIVGIVLLAGAFFFWRLSLQMAP